MIPNPKDIAVEELSGASVSEETCVIEVEHWASKSNGEAEVSHPTEFRLSLEGSGAIAVSKSAQALSRWALDRGARAVRFDFDLRFNR